MKVTFICGHKSRPMRRRVALYFPVDSMAWCPTCHDLRQITKAMKNARSPKVGS